MHSIRIHSALLMIVLFFWTCEKQERELPNEQPELAGAKIETPKTTEITEPLVAIDLPQINKRGNLVALTAYNANSYFIYFEYELLKLLADHLKVDLEIVIVHNLDQIFNKLNEGVGDIIAYNLTITKKRLRKVSFTDHHSVIRQVLVQKLPHNWHNMKRHEIDNTLITNPIDLIGKKIHVRKGSSYYSRLVNLSDEIGGDIDIVEVPGDVSTEELIRQVAEGEIEYTVCDENLAMINQIYYSNIDIRTAISFPQRIAWAVRKNSPLLEEAIGRWLDQLKREPTFNVIYNRYYQNERYFRQRIKSEYLSTTGGKISPYDSLIQSGAQKLGWDWRLIASQIYQESQFDPRAKSWVGATGLMQLMPRIGREFGAKNLYNPSQNIAAGTNFLQWLEEYWEEIPDSLEKMKFILASYNAGQGHVQDARRLAEKFDKDPYKWDENVAELMLKKSQEKYYTDEVVEFGYCRGDEPVNYVKDILDRYDHYQRFIQP
jgi:membrane-bound lytic murein transglycosylase F